MATLSVSGVRKAINKLAAHANKRIRVLKRQKKASQLESLGERLYEIRDVIEDAIGVFENLSADAEHAASDVEDEAQGDE